VQHTNPKIKFWKEKSTWENKNHFAVSEVSAYIKKISINSFNKFLNDYLSSLLKSYISFDELIKKIKEKEFKLIKMTHWQMF